MNISIASILAFILHFDVSSGFSSPAPPRRELCNELKVTLFPSNIAYIYSQIVEAATAEKFNMQLPPDFPDHYDLSRFQNEEIDFTDFDESGDGMPFRQLKAFFDLNKDCLVRNHLIDEYKLVDDVMRRLVEINGKTHEEQYYLSKFRTFDQDKSCVYGVFMNRAVLPRPCTMRTSRYSRRIIVSFRGSKNPSIKDLVPSISNNFDWLSNLNYFLTPMPTPVLIKDKMEEDLQDTVLVHEGFYNYLFNNTRIEGQIFQNVIDDIRPLIEKEEEDFDIYFTGHSLGGALASMSAFKIAGMAEDWIPKPISCVTFASPIIGTDQFGAAFEQLEKDHLIRYLRVTNAEDPVPNCLPTSFSMQPMQHTGIHLPLKSTKDFVFTHSSNPSSRVNRASELFQGVLKVILYQIKYHAIGVYNERYEEFEKDFRRYTFDKLYDDKNIVGKDFKVDRENQKS